MHSSGVDVYKNGAEKLSIGTNKKDAGNRSRADQATIAVKDQAKVKDRDRKDIKEVSRPVDTVIIEKRGRKNIEKLGRSNSATIKNPEAKNSTTEDAVAENPIAKYLGRVNTENGDRKDIKEVVKLGTTLKDSKAKDWTIDDGIPEDQNKAKVEDRVR